MSTLAAMVTELESEVPAVDGVPTSGQYTKAVQDAVVDFSRRCGLMKFGTLNVISGTATYNLPDDFLKLIFLESLIGVDGVILTNTGIIPVSALFEEEYTIINKQITFTPTPNYTATRSLKYKCAWIATTGDYTTLGADEEQIVMLKAKSNALDKQANAQAGSSIKYSFGAVSEDLGGTPETLRKMVYALEQEYAAACQSYNGQYAAYGGGG